MTEIKIPSDDLKELLGRSREATLSAIQIFNNPSTFFKLESFIVLMIIAWRCLLHAYYQSKGIEYWEIDRSKNLERRYWALEKCLNKQQCPLDSPTKENLKFLIGLRNEIEHHYSEKVTYYLSSRYVTCCHNFERVITELFGDEYSIASHLYLAIQFQDTIPNISSDNNIDGLPTNVAEYITDFDSQLSEEDFQHPHFAYRILFTRKVANKRGQADRIIEFVDAKSEMAEEINKQYWVQKEVEKPKYLPKDIERIMQREGYPQFKIHHNTKLWQMMDAKDLSKGYGVEVSGQWYWYERWVNEVRQHCADNKESYA